MLSGSELTTAIAAVLIGAVVVGFLLNWLWSHLTRSPDGDSERLAALAAQLHDADLAREEAEEAKQQVEALLVRREAECADRLAQMQARLDARPDGGSPGREAELIGELEAARLELKTMRAAPKKAPERVVKRNPKAKAKG